MYVKLLQEVHDKPTTGHPGIGKTLRLMKQRYYWPSMEKTVKQYISNCHVCQRTKPPRDTYNGLLQPLPIPQRPWKDISLDFVTGLPLCEGNNAILVVACRLTKQRHYIPCFAGNEGTTTEATAQLLLQHVWKHHGLPDTIISDRGPQFVALVWKGLCRALKIQTRLSTAFHPETDGQTE
jgi:transposase InsO family protein